MKKIFFDIIKWIAFTLLSIIIPGVIYLGIFSLTGFLLNLDLSTFLIIFIFIVGIGANFTLPIIISALLGIMMSLLCPNLKVGTIIFSIISMCIYFFLLLNIWMLPGNYPFNSVLILIIMTLLVITIGFSTIKGLQEDI